MRRQHSVKIEVNAPYYARGLLSSVKRNHKRNTDLRQWNCQSADILETCCVFAVERFTLSRSIWRAFRSCMKMSQSARQAGIILHQFKHLNRRLHLKVTVEKWRSYGKCALASTGRQPSSKFTQKWPQMKLRWPIRSHSPISRMSKLKPTPKCFLRAGLLMLAANTETSKCILFEFDLWLQLQRTPIISRHLQACNGLTHDFGETSFEIGETQAVAFGTAYNYPSVNMWQSWSKVFAWLKWSRMSLVECVLMRMSFTKILFSGKHGLHRWR